MGHIEPMPSGHAGFLTLLEELRKLMPNCRTARSDRPLPVESWVSGLPVFLVELLVGDGGDFGGGDFAAAAPEDVGVADGDADGLEVFVDGCFVSHDAVFFGAVNDAHDVDVAEEGPAFTPVAVGHAVVATDLGTGFDFAAFGDGPVEEAVEAGDALAGVGGFGVLEEGGEAADDLLLIEALSDFEETFERDAGDFGAAASLLGELKE